MTGVELRPESDRPINPYWEYFKNNDDRFAEEARNIAVTGQSWRNFRVGGFGLAIDKEGNHHPLFGANRSPFPGSPKSCAEMNLIDQAEMLGWRLFAIVTSGPPQIDQVSHVESPTLQACHACRQREALILSGETRTDEYEEEKIPAIDENTIMQSVDPRRMITEIYTVRELLDLHKAAMERRPIDFNAYGPPPLKHINSFKDAVDDFGLSHPEIVFALPTQLSE